MCKIQKQLYPAVFSIDTSGNGANLNIEKKHQENIEELVSVLAGKVMGDIENLVKDVTGGSEVKMEPDMTSPLLQEVARLGEKEPYGMRGGQLVLIFTDGQKVHHKLGIIALDPDTIETYQLQINLFESKDGLDRMRNMMRKMWGQPRRVILDKFHIKKKRLYGP